MKAIDPTNGEVVAIKKVRIFNQNQALPQAFYRETSNLQTLKHPNIINLREIFRSNSGEEPYMVFDYCEFDLDGLIHSRNTKGLPLQTVKCYFKQILNAVKACHDLNIVHRDLKPANIFITRDNVVKLGDFGLSRDLTKGNSQRTLGVVTPGYRAPEIILGNTQYDYSSDIWSLGAILFEMLTGIPLFRPLTSSDISQLAAIVFVLGKPNENDFANNSCSNINLLNMVRDSDRSLEGILSECLVGESAEAIPLILGMLKYNPSQRITVDEALCSQFLSDPNETDYSNLPKISFAETHSLDVANNSVGSKPYSNSPPVRPLRVQLVPIVA
ncbi:CMGC family protein kinase [Trichomonas vaginalis G3]|uniref:CMGC family protein kinase n=1 Tax=Trichomonas vaginalis (strain ATCC PRA-98 / G3) TaxID=412133 RepID=A2G665_TRIV3|nr:cyclin-dependent protein serine/threonine kinase protein [Trichomonas vaginalis G3]EAX87361.1 CMGC family protein kinase [Trichomonas vaginalis G3]KAI5497814.1 cyclin-dependent protein serine/threonine kinase protein [Trichomonas vaginalis G3]|eukprot:XP_001300291.1 CMGC family protein kinase [Trichomonas vaginalis G3]